MSKVQEFELNGYELFFHMRESRFEPPHFHITKPGESWKLKVLFMECTETHLALEIQPDHLSVNQLPRNKVNELLHHILIHQDALHRRWNEIVGVE